MPLSKLMELEGAEGVPVLLQLETVQLEAEEQLEDMPGLSYQLQLLGHLKS
jgi:hypothetical protein